MPASAAIKVMTSAAFKEAYLELVPQFEHASGHPVVTKVTHALTAFFKAPAAHALIRAKGMEPA